MNVSRITYHVSLVIALVLFIMAAAASGAYADRGGGGPVQRADIFIVESIDIERSTILIKQEVPSQNTSYLRYITLYVTDETRITDAGKPIEFADIGPGEEAVIEFESDGLGNADATVISLEWDKEPPKKVVRKRNQPKYPM